MTHIKIGKAARNAMNNGHKPAAVHLTGGKTVYATFAEMRDGYLYMRNSEYEHDEEIVGEYVPMHNIDSVTRLRSKITEGSQ